MKTRKIKAANNAHSSPLLIKSLFDYSTKLNPENEIIYRDVSRYNYWEFQKRVCKYANMLKNIGLDGGETVAVIDYDSHRYLEAYFAIPMTGNVLHMVNWRLSSQQILYTMNHAEDLVLIVHADFLPVVENLASQIPSLKYLIVCKDDVTQEIKSDVLDIYGEYEELMAQASDKYEFETFDEDSVATLFYTTGTSGDPKGVYFTHKQLVLHTYNLMSTFSFTDSLACRLTSGDVYMPLTPMFHVHAWGFPYLMTAFSTKQVYLGKFSPDVFVDLFRKEKPTMSHCVPTILQMILNHDLCKELDLKNWKAIIGGDTLSKKITRSALESGIDLVVGYGMSESCPVISVARVDPKFKDADIETQVELRTKAGLQPLLMEVQIINDEGEFVAQDDKEQGEVVVRAPWLTTGYYNDEIRGEELWEDGYLHTGDIATIDANNLLNITDRKKNVIKSGGEWISSVQLETIISGHPAVAEVIVVGIPDEKWGERPYVQVVLRGEANDGIKKELKDLLKNAAKKEVISKWAIPEIIEFVAEIPKTSVGKLNKKLVKEQIINSLNLAYLLPQSKI